MKISMKQLNEMTPDIKGDKVNIYYLNSSYLIKRFLRLNDSEKRMKLDRFTYARNIGEIERVSLPVDILETEKGFCGYIEKILPGTLEGDLVCFTDYVNQHQHDITLEEITAYILDVCDSVAMCHKHGIINPDMASFGNVKYHLGTKKAYLTDFQDMQVGDITTNAISSFIAFDKTISLPKYHNGDKLTTNLDLYTLAIRYFYYTTKLNIPRASLFNVPIEEILRGSGIEHTEFAECLKTLYHPSKPNQDIRGPIEEINKQFVLSRYTKGEPRSFIRK